MARQRSYQIEYQRRLARAAGRGLSRSQARGHPRAGEKPVRPPKTAKSDRQLEVALKALARTRNQSTAAKEARVSPERLRRFLRENALAVRRGRTWHITDQRLRRMTVWTDGETKELTFRGFEQASLVGRHSEAVKQFLRTNDRLLLKPFEGQAMIDAKGKSHPLETDPNTIHRVAHAGGDVFTEIYRLVQ